MSSTRSFHTKESMQGRFPGNFQGSLAGTSVNRCERPFAVAEAASDDSVRCAFLVRPPSPYHSYARIGEGVPSGSHAGVRLCSLAYCGGQRQLPAGGNGNALAGAPVAGRASPILSEMEGGCCVESC